MCISFRLDTLTLPIIGLLTKNQYKTFMLFTVMVYKRVKLFGLRYDVCN